MHSRSPLRGRMSQSASVIRYWPPLRPYFSESGRSAQKLLLRGSQILEVLGRVFPRGIIADTWCAFRRGRTFPLGKIGWRALYRCQ